MRDGVPILAEAGTGVGKSLAYLVPALRATLEGKRTIVSTYAISLQNQHNEKDNPLVFSLFPGKTEGISYEVMKGRGNYLCRLELENARSNLLLLADPNTQKIRRWADRDDCRGDVGELPFAFDAWSELVSTQDTCPGQACPHYDKCFYYRMRRAAGAGKIIVVNHALFLSDLVLRAGDPNGGILPDYDHVVFDEAHRLEDVATKTFGVEFGSRRITAIIERVKQIKGLDIDKSRLETLEQKNGELFIPLPTGR